MISTRGRYVLRVMIDLAQHEDGAYHPMREVAVRQGISVKYLERILPPLSRGGLLEGVQGKGGGYRLKRPPKECSVGEILRLTEGGMAPVACLEAEASPCPRQDCCTTFPMWREFYQLTNDYFDSITLEDFLSGRFAQPCDGPE